MVKRTRRSSRRSAKGPSQAFARLTAQDRFVLRFWHRYGAFVPLKGITLRVEAELRRTIAELGGADALREIFADDQVDETIEARQHEIGKWLRDGYPANKTGIDRITKAAVQFPIDEIAIKKGCRYDVARALFAVEWMESHLVLYEGECAGQPFVCHDWQDVVSRRLFGWVVWSKKWSRFVRRMRRVIVFIAKKNKKSPSLAAWSIYTGFGDGEPGNHVYLCAKDGQQARKIAGRHTIEMIERSPLLAPECKINRNEQEVTHRPTSSTILPLSSSNARTTQSKEGLNGSYFVDESHVVDWAYVDRLKRMGLSRPEPIAGDLSTAGTNPDGYGKGQFDYGLAVNEAKHVEDIRTCAAIYAMPQNLTAKQFCRSKASMIRYGKMANPAWGHTIDPEEFLDDWATSQKSVMERRNFFMYRGNIWQKTASPWLQADKWEACAEDYTSGDLVGRICGGAWDLMRSKDMAALGLLFPEEDTADELEARADIPYRSLIYYWMPEAALELYEKKVPMLADWAEAGWITLIEGATINCRQIEMETAAILKQFNCQRFHFDPMFATASVQQLVEAHGFDEERLVEFPQTRKYYSYPIIVAEKLITEGKFRHNDNPVTNWQAGHVCCKEYDGKRLLCKPDGEDQETKKIDGIAAMIMGFDAALRRESNGSIYNERGLLTL